MSWTQISVFLGTSSSFVTKHFHLSFLCSSKKIRRKKWWYFGLCAPKLQNAQKITHWANKSNIQNFNRLSILFYCSLFLQSALLPAPHGDCIKIFTSASTKPAPPESSLNLSRQPHREIGSQQRGSFKLPPPAFKHTTYLHLFHSASQFLLKPASVFLGKIKSSVYILSPFPQKIISYQLHPFSSVSSNISSLLICQIWSFKYAESYF